MQPTEMKYASFVKRLVACLIDIIACIVLSTSVILVELGIYKIVNQDFNFNNPNDFNFIYVLMASSTSILTLIYFSVMESSKWQGGIGKIKMKLQIIDGSGHKLHFGKAFIRAVLKCITIGMYPVYLSVLFTKKKKTYYDYLLNTSVVELQQERVYHEL